MTRIRPAPYIPPELWKLMPSLAPPAVSPLKRPPHLLNLVTGHVNPIDKYVAQRRRLVKTGTADLYYKIVRVEYQGTIPTGVKAHTYYRGYPVYKIPRWILFGRMTEQTYDFVSGRGKLFHDSTFPEERDRALEVPGVSKLLELLASPEEMKGMDLRGILNDISNATEGPSEGKSPK